MKAQQWLLSYLYILINKTWKKRNVWYNKKKNKKLNASYSVVPRLGFFFYEDEFVIYGNKAQLLGKNLKREF